jgi:hypothetical protein
LLLSSHEECEEFLEQLDLIIPDGLHALFQSVLQAKLASSLLLLVWEEFQHVEFKLGAGLLP